MPSLNGGKKRKSTRGRKSPGRKVSRKSPGRKVSRKSGRKSRGVRGGKYADMSDYAKGAAYGAALGQGGFELGSAAAKKLSGYPAQAAPWVGGALGAVAGAGGQYMRA